MPAVVSTKEERAQARKDRRAAAARRRYHANPEASREKCKSAKQAQRSRDGQEFPPEPGRVNYDPEDYAEEWEFLTDLGMRSDQIIANSRPSRDWFKKRVLPLVTRAICASCGSVFNPQKVHMLTMCSHACNSKKK